MRITLYISSFFFIICVTILAQNQDEIHLQQVGVNNKIPENVSGYEELNKAYINQSGSENTVLLKQITGTQNQPGNNAEIYQYGNENNTGLFISGNSNSISLSQEGDANITMAEILGYLNIFDVVQSGHSNEIYSTVQGNNLSYKFEQFGSRNSIIQKENNPDSKSYSIIQKGEGMKIIITNGIVE
jgi:hypothetical protein